MTTKIYLVRHGESTANEEGLFLGQKNRDLTQKGHLQAEKSAEFLKNKEIDKIYSSDLDRACQTAEHLAVKKGMKVITDKGIREIDAGEWDFKKFTDLPTLYPEEYAVWLTDVGHARCTGGESFVETQERVYSAMERIAQENLGKTIAIYSHGTAIQSFICKVKGVDLSRVRKDLPYATNASVTTLLYTDGKFTVEEYSRDDFMGEGLVTFLPTTV